MDTCSRFSLRGMIGGGMLSDGAAALPLPMVLMTPFCVRRLGGMAGGISSASQSGGRESGVKVSMRSISWSTSGGSMSNISAPGSSLPPSLLLESWENFYRKQQLTECTKNGNKHKSRHTDKILNKQKKLIPNIELLQIPNIEFIQNP